MTLWIIIERLRTPENRQESSEGDSCDPRYLYLFLEPMYKYEALPPPNNHRLYLPIALN